MLGFNIGSLNTSISYCKLPSEQNRLHFELLLSDTSKRTCPSIISFTDSNRLIGDQASLTLRKNINSSFIYLSRLIGLDISSEFAKEENIYHYIGPKLNSTSSDNNKNEINKSINNDTYTFEYLGKTYNLSSSQIIAGFLDILKNTYITNKNISYDSCVFSAPDYFTCSQKLAYLNIIKSIIGNEKKVYLINDSTAITLYYGYKKYKEYFLSYNKELNGITVNPTIVKNIIFIDAGNSKTTFVLSRLSCNLFKVLDSVTIPFLGGRNFDEKLYQFCCKKFNEKNGKDISNNNKVKIRLMNAIEKARKMLTVNKDAIISIDSLYDGIDFTYTLTREEFEKDIIKDEIEIFKKTFESFYNKNVQLFENLDLNIIEMAGELMRTPCLEKIIKDVTGLNLSKSIITDECIAIGSALYGSLMKGCFPIRGFKGIYHINNYSINYKINDEQQKLLISKQFQIPYFHVIKLDEKYFDNNDNKKINISFYHLKNEIEFFVSENNTLLYEFEFDKEIILKQTEGNKNLNITFMVDNNGFVHINKMSYNIDNNNEKEIGFNIEGIVKVSKRNMYLNSNDLNKTIENIKTNESEFIKTDDEFLKYSNEHNQLESKLYEIKNKINEKNKNDFELNGKKIKDILDECENNLIDSQKKIIDLKDIKTNLENIINVITPEDVKKEKENLMNKINNLKNNLDVNKLTVKQYNDCNNMLNNFNTKIELSDDLNEIKSINNEIDIECKKYNL